MWHGHAREIPLSSWPIGRKSRRIRAEFKRPCARYAKRKQKQITRALSRARFLQSRHVAKFATQHPRDPSWASVSLAFEPRVRINFV